MRGVGIRLIAYIYTSTDAHTAQRTNRVSKGHTSAVEHPYKYTRLSKMAEQLRQ